VRILPNHACVVANLADRLLAMRGGRLEAELPVMARGRVE
jgi:D-serine deaminase-like pyridoxal phosphate-dependent protein